MTGCPRIGQTGLVDAINRNQ